MSLQTSARDNTSADEANAEHKAQYGHTSQNQQAFHDYLPKFRVYASHL